MANAVPTFDRLSSIDRLKSGGIGDDEARAHASALDAALRDTVATKSDVEDLGAALRSDMAGLGRELRSDMADLGRELRSEMADARHDLRTQMADVRRDLREVEVKLNAKIETAIAANKVEILRWLLVTQVALGGLSSRC